MLLKLPVLLNTKGNMSDCQPLKEIGSVLKKKKKKRETERERKKVYLF